MTSEDMADVAEGEPDDQSVQSLIGAEQEDILLIDIGGKQLLIRAKDVSEIIRPIPMTLVPMGPEHLLGLANVRGQIVCMIDPSKVLQLPSIGSEVTTHTRFVLLRHAKMHIGIWVDKVEALFRVNSADIPAAAQVDASEPGCGSMQIEDETYEMLNYSRLFQ